MPPTLAITAGALLIEAACGYPAWLFRRVGHPVTWIGALIAGLDRRLNEASLPAAVRRRRGVLAVALLLGATLLPALLLQTALLVLLPRLAAIAVLAVLASSLLASRSLHAHVRAVADALQGEGLAAGRAAVAHIVGRETAGLDEAGVVRAAIESLAENFADGVVAPALWGALLGLPGLVAYKAINTADSMIGHRTPRHEAFGWAAARLDDWVNLPASRLAAFWLAAAAGRRAGAAARIVRRDARAHRSPNAGWPEAAMAGALGLRLNGPRLYGAVLREDAWTGEGRAEATGDDLRRALRLYGWACALQVMVVVGGEALLF